ncbi:YbjQ family protein [Ruegeria sp. Alg231-54]|uniref:YbjQ family protein n=1 Tax=Ruegeria sp. Alg231-54 TaxID=1922221 RepID=UPI001F19A08F|nr:YbjQ family protein [Ruegeria sp. Alg231-54]
MGLQARGETLEMYEDRRRDELREELETERRCMNVVATMVVTTETAHNLPVTERIGIVAGETVLGLNVFKDIMADVRGAVGGKSQTMQIAMKDAREQAVAELKLQAAEIGADAVVGVDIVYQDIGNTGKMMMVAATGTAVKLAA